MVYNAIYIIVGPQTPCLGPQNDYVSLTLCKVLHAQQYYLYGQFHLTSTQVAIAYYVTLHVLNE